MKLTWVREQDIPAMQGKSWIERFEIVQGVAEKHPRLSLLHFLPLPFELLLVGGALYLRVVKVVLPFDRAWLFTGVVILLAIGRMVYTHTVVNAYLRRILAGDSPA